MRKPVYMDQSAATRVSKALAATPPLFREGHGNPSAVYGTGQGACTALEAAWSSVVPSLLALKSEIFSSPEAPANAATARAVRC
jgi:cysteine sulfinate desulfinase/cysteine desulfurase-like protein